MAAESEIIDLRDEALFPDSGLSITDSISVEHYDEDRSLQQAILASLLTNSSSSSIIDLTQEEEDDDVVNRSTSRKKELKRRNSETICESSSNPRNPPAQSQSFVCEICFDPKPLTESFCIEGCTHVYCKECMSSYVAAKLQDSVPQIGCPSPGCQGILESHYCREILPLEVFERWGNILCESVIGESEKFYCPFKDCSALLLNDGDTEDVAVITQSECLHCNRLFCAQCKCPWHWGIECSEFQQLNEAEREKEDIMLMNLAKDKKWKRCPQCKMFVEKSAGCMYMKCRCQFAFCYNCGAASTSNGHICSKCGH
ncbi:unnamed protein product [Rhodiola kirilowii]